MHARIPAKGNNVLSCDVKEWLFENDRVHFIIGVKFIFSFH